MLGLHNSTMPMLGLHNSTWHRRLLRATSSRQQGRRPLTARPNSKPRKARAYARRVVKFGLVGATGLAVNTGLLALFGEVFGIHYLVGAILATQGSTAWNYVITDAWVFRGRVSGRSQLRRYGLFWALNNGALLIRAPLLWLLTTSLGMHYLLSNLITLLVVMVGRYLLSEFWIWHDRSGSDDLAWR